MSNRYKGGVISATPPTTTGGESGTASGAWTLEQQMQLTAAGNWPIQPLPKYIEDVFSTYLYTGNGSTQTITNGIDLSGKGGLVWIKWRSSVYGSVDHNLYDTSRGVLNRIYSNLTAAETNQPNSLTAFNSDGFSLGGTSGTNGSGANYASWTFREQPKFFDVVTYTGNDTAGRTIAHNLGSVPGCIIVKPTNSPMNWFVYHRSLGNTKSINLNLTSAATTVDNWGNTTPTSTVFTVDGGSETNQAGVTYVAYLFAHDAGGFGLTGTDNVISCGSYTGNGTTVGPDVNLGYEPQFLMVKNTSAAGSWFMWDSMRGITADGTTQNLTANSSSAENTSTSAMSINATGFSARSAVFSGSGSTYIYIAIRRGPMKVPTSGTSVFYPTAWTGSMATRNTTTGFVTDLNISRMRQNFSSASNLGAYWGTRLTGATQYLHSDATAAEASQTDGLTSFASNTGVVFGADSTVQAWNYDNNYRNWSFKRAPGFFDEVCYTGTGTYGPLNHNLGVIPEWIIGKPRSATGDWIVIYLNSPTNLRYVTLNSSSASANWGTALNTSTEFYGTDDASGTTYVSYLFATCPGVSKVGSYTGNGSSQTINCGFVAGARFVMIKAASTTGNWVLADTNMINPGVDQALYMNNADLQNISYDWIDIDSTGFIVNETATIAANTNGVTYIFLAIA